MDLTIEGIGSMLAAIAALGAAAFGLVDACKAIPGGGLSRLGFRYVLEALEPYAPCLDRALGHGRWRDSLMAHWINGRPLDEQKAVARSLIRLGLTAETVPQLPDSLNLDRSRLQTAAAKLETGEELSEIDLNLLGRLDAVIEAELQAAFDYADQAYRARARAWAGVAAIVLAMLGLLVWRGGAGASIGWRDVAQAFLIGVLAVPIAPIAKDLSSAIAAGAKAVSSLRPAA